MSRLTIDVSKSLQELERQDWGEPAGTSRLVRECQRLRRVPLRALSPEDLRLLLGQGIGTSYLMPIVLALLTHDPLIAGDYYPGDLLCATLTTPTTVWEAHPGWRRQATALARQALTRLRATTPVASERVAAALQEQLAAFLHQEERP